MRLGEEGLYTLGTNMGGGGFQPFQQRGYASNIRLSSTLNANLSLSRKLSSNVLGSSTLEGDLSKFKNLASNVALSSTLEGTVSLGIDPDALAFITAHEANTGVPMGEQQKNAVNQTVKLAKGQNAEGLNIWTKIKRWACYAPINDATANAAAYAVDLVEPSILHTLVGFVAGDFLPSGLIGGSGKYLNMNFNPIARGSSVSSFGLGSDATTAGSVVAYIMGSSGAGGTAESTTQLVLSASSTPTNIAETFIATSSTNPVSGLLYHTVNDTTISVYSEGVFKGSRTRTASNFYNGNIFAHARNALGTASTFDARRFRGFIITDGLSATEFAALQEVWTYYQNNIVTGGR